MPQSLSAVYLHLVFSTKDRRPLLADANLRARLHAYIGATSRELDCIPLQVGGVADHVHILARNGREVAQARMGEGSQARFIAVDEDTGRRIEGL